MPRTVLASPSLNDNPIHHFKNNNKKLTLPPPSPPIALQKRLPRQPFLGNRPLPSHPPAPRPHQNHPLIRDTTDPPRPPPRPPHAHPRRLPHRPRPRPLALAPRRRRRRRRQRARHPRARAPPQDRRGHPHRHGRAAAVLLDREAGPSRRVCHAGCGRGASVRAPQRGWDRERGGGKLGGGGEGGH